jgi:hypothetical protein
MKSMHETRFWNNVKSRLQRYSEEPDDDWNFIATRIPSRRNGWLDTSGHFFSAVAIVSLLFLLHPLTNRSMTTAIATETTRENYDSVALSVARQKIELPNAELNVIAEIDLNKTRGEISEAEGNVISNENIPTENSQVREDRRRQPKRLSDGKQSQQAVLQMLEKSSPDISLIDETMEKISETSRTEIYSVLSQTGSGDSASLPDNANRLASNEDKLDTVRVITRQKSDKKKQSWFHPLIYFDATPTLTYFKITPDKNDDVLITRVKKDGLLSHNRLGFQLQGGFQHKLNKSFDLFVGVSYFSQRQHFTYDYLSSAVTDIQSTDNLKYTISPETAMRSFELNSRTAGISAGAFYLLKESALSHRLGAGIQYQANLMSYKSEEVLQRSSSTILNYMILYRLQLSLSNRLDVYVQPAYTHTLRGYKILGEPLAIKPYRVGIGMGLLYRF